MAVETIEAQVQNLEAKEGGKQTIWERTQDRIVRKIEEGEIGEVGDSRRD